MICTRCGYRFTLHPKKNGVKITDCKFQAIVRKASANGTTFFTPEELYLKAVQRLRTTKLASSWSALCLTFVIACSMFMITSNPQASAIVAAVMFCTLLLIFFNLPNVIDRDDWRSHVAEWRAVKGEVKGMIRKPELHQPPQNWYEEDIYAHGLSRILIVEEDLQVDWLVRNRFHMHHATLVLSRSGYPAYIQEFAVLALEQNPDLQVFLLHNTDPKAAQMHDNVPASKNLDLSNHSVFDLGITEASLTAFGIRKPLIRAYKGKFPVHALSYPVLANLLGAAMDQKLSLQEVYKQQKEQADTTSMGFMFSSDGGGCCGGDGDGE